MKQLMLPLQNHKNKVKYEEARLRRFQWLAFGGVTVVFTGLLKQTNDDELARVIAQQLAHNTAGHRRVFLPRVAGCFWDKPTGIIQSRSRIFTNKKQIELQLYTLL